MRNMQQMLKQKKDTKNSHVKKIEHFESLIGTLFNSVFNNSTLDKLPDTIALMVKKLVCPCTER